MTNKKLHFSGVIEKVTGDGRSAMVRLANPVEGKKVAIISRDTRGRIVLMNGKGRLEVGTNVSGDGRVGPDALDALLVHAG